MNQMRHSAPGRSLLLLASLAGTVTVAACTNGHNHTNYEYSTASPWPTRAIMPADPNGWIVTTNNLDDTLSLVDRTTMTTLFNLPVGFNPVELEGPHHIATSSDGQFLYVGLTETFPTSAAGPHGSHGTGTNPGYLLKIKTADGSLAGSVRVDRNPGDVIVSHDGSKVFVSHFDVKRIIDQTAAGGSEPSKWSGIAIVDSATMQKLSLVMVCPAEHGMALSNDDKTLYVTCYGGDTVAVVDVSDPVTPLVTSVLEAGPNPVELPGTQRYQPYAATLSSDGQIAWFSCWGSGDIRPLHTATGVLDTAGAVYVGGFPVFGTAWGDRMAIARQSGQAGFFEDRLEIIGSNGVLVAEYQYPSTQCINAHMVLMMPGQPDTGVMVCEGDHLHAGTLMTIDLPTGVVLSTASVGIFPDGASFVPAGVVP